MDSNLLSVIYLGGAVALLVLIPIGVLAGAQLTRWWFGTSAIQKELAATHSELAAIRALLEKAAY